MNGRLRQKRSFTRSPPFLPKLVGTPFPRCIALRRSMQNETGGQATWEWRHPLCRRHRL